MKFILGIDESGTGAWAGPFCVSGVLLRETQVIPGVTDSKKLSDKKRRKLVPEIEDSALWHRTEHVSAARIWCQGQGPLWQFAIELIVIRCLDFLFENDVPATSLQVIVDGSPVEALHRKLSWHVPQPTQITFEPGADLNHAAVASASILAKTSRNDKMNKLAVSYPEYGFEKNAGYGTEQHAKALDIYGYVKHIHRPLVENFYISERKSDDQ